MNTKNTLLERFKNNFQDLQRADWSKLGEIYANEIVFRDPVHELRGLVVLEDYLTTLCADLNDCRFEYLDQVASDEAAYLKWVMHFKHPRLGNQAIDVRGVSHIRWSEKIEFHEDFYDLGAMLYERLPVLGNVTRWLRLRLAS
jgi:hypothetical protein